MERLKKFAKKILIWKPDNRLVAVVAVAALFFLILPLLKIARFTTPWYDDYKYGGFVKNFLEEDYTLANAWRGLVYCVKTQWWAWQGTFSSVALMTLVPMVWREDLYYLGPMFLILFLCVAVFLLVKVLVKDVLKADWNSCILLQVFTTAIVVEMIHTAGSGFFWYNAGIHYVGMHSFFMIFVAILVKLMTNQKILSTVWLFALSMIFAVLVSGANFVTTLQGLLAACSVMAVGVMLKKKRTFLLIPSLVIYGVGFYLNISAPGNGKRAAYFVGMGMNPVKAVLQSFVEAFTHIWPFTGWMTVAFLILAAPFIWQMVQKVEYQFRLPGLVLFWSFCFYATGFTPSLYSMGSAGLGRTLNAVKFTYQILLVCNEVYWLGYFCKKLQQKRTVPSGKCYWWFYGIVAAGMLLIFVRTKNPYDTYSTWGAYYFNHTGDAYNYYQEYLARVQTIENGEDDVVVTPYLWNPWVIRMGELTENPDSEENRAMADWYCKNSIRCKTEE